MIFSPSKSWTLGLALLALGLGSRVEAETDYFVRVDPTAKRINITIKAPGNSGPTSFQMPSWMPGHYVLDFYSKDVHDVTATDSKGATLALEHPEASTWTVPTTPGNISLSYWIPIGSYRRFALPNDDSFVQIAGAVHFMYVVGKKEERCKVTYELPTGWPALTGLDPVGRTGNSFVAPTYDVLIDNPLSTGNVIVDHYQLRGKTETIVLEGNLKTDVDRSRLLDYCKFVSAAEADFFGGTPYHRYVWHFIVQPGGGGGGLEHLSSTQISFGSGISLSTENLLAHEHFHLWNVKRIRSKVLGPFDYTKLPQTGALWWLEGVTDYYASLLPYRYGGQSKDQFFNTLGQGYGQLEASPARLEVSPYQSSFRLDESPGARGSSGANSGYRISFYNLGWLAGLCLDTEIRFQTKGRFSLDDVIRKLFEECKNDQPGFAEDEIRNQAIKFGGPELGPFFDKVVMNPGEMPVPAQLEKIGIKIALGSRDLGTLGFSTGVDPTGDAIVKRVSPANQGKLAVGDHIKVVDGVAATSTNIYLLNNLIIDANFAGGLKPMLLTVLHDGQTAQVTIEPTKRTVNRWSVSEDPTASPEAVMLRAQWLRVKKLR